MSLIKSNSTSKKLSRVGTMSGFTMIELLVTLGIVVILAAVAIPQFTSIMQAQQANSEITNLQNDLEYARNEAVKEGQTVSLCVSTNGTTCTGTTWDKGWIVFSDPTSAGAIVTGGTATTDSTILRSQSGFTSGDSIATTPASTTVMSYNRDGIALNLTVGTGLLFKLTNKAPVNTAAERCIWLGTLGPQYIQKYNATMVSGQGTKCT